jgi:hypothetical protein
MHTRKALKGPPQAKAHQDGHFETAVIFDVSDFAHIATCEQLPLQSLDPGCLFMSSQSGRPEAVRLATSRSAAFSSVMDT